MKLEELVANLEYLDELFKSRKHSKKSETFFEFTCEALKCEDYGIDSVVSLKSYLLSSVNAAKKISNDLISRADALSLFLEGLVTVLVYLKSGDKASFDYQNILASLNDATDLKSLESKVAAVVSRISNKSRVLDTAALDRLNPQPTGFGCKPIFDYVGYVDGHIQFVGGISTAPKDVISTGVLRIQGKSQFANTVMGIMKYFDERDNVYNTAIFKDKPDDHFTVERLRTAVKRLLEENSLDNDLVMVINSRAHANVKRVSFSFLGKVMQARVNNSYGSVKMKDEFSGQPCEIVVL